VLSLDKLVVSRVTANPKPKQAVFYFYRQCPIVNSNTNRPITPGPLEMKRRMFWVFLEDFEITISYALNGRR